MAEQLDTKPLISAGFNPRFPNTNQTRNCWANYLEKPNSTTIYDSTEITQTGVVARDDQFPDLPTRGTGELLDNKRDLGVLHLDSVTDESLQSYLGEIRTEKLNKQGRDLTNLASLVPGLSAQEKYILLPTFQEIEDHPNRRLYGALAIIANRLGFRTYLLPEYKKRIRDVNEEQSKFCTGMAFIVEDMENHFNISEKVEPYEAGRTFARSQQILGIFESNKKLGLNALKKNHRFFGNNPGETTAIGKVRVPVPFKAKELRNLFREQDWSEALESLTVSLFRKYHDCLAKDIMDTEIKKNLITYSEVVQLYCTRDVIVGKQKGHDIIKSRVPHKPRSSNLLLKEEQRVVNNISDPVFNDGIPTDVDGFYHYVCKHGFDQTIKFLRAKSSKKAEFLQKFSSLTTKRLTEIRRIAPDSSKTKRKKDLSVCDAQVLIAYREDRYNEFASELLNLDPRLELALAQFKVLMKDSEVIDRLSTKSKVIDYVKAEICYEEIIPKNLLDEAKEVFEKRLQDEERARAEKLRLDQLKKEKAEAARAAAAPLKKAEANPSLPWHATVINNALDSMVIEKNDIGLYRDLLLAIGERNYNTSFADRQVAPAVSELTKEYPQALIGAQGVAYRKDKA